MKKRAAPFGSRSGSATSSGRGLLERALVTLPLVALVLVLAGGSAIAGVFQQPPAEAKAPPAAAADEVRFDPQAAPAVSARRARTGQLLVQVSVEALAPRWFLLDSGAGGWGIDPALADEAGLLSIGDDGENAAGRDGATLWRQGRAVRVGPVTLPRPRFLEIDCGPLNRALGVELSGICGYELFRDCVVELDLEAATVRIFDPASFELKDAPWQELVLQNKLPCVRARFEGNRQGLFKLDTGAGKGSVLFHSPAVREMGLLAGRVVSDAESAETFGTLNCKTGRLEYLLLGGRRFNNPLVGFSVDERGARADSSTTGTIARELLTPFRLVFDYSHSRIAFAPRTQVASSR